MYVCVCARAYTHMQAHAHTAHMQAHAHTAHTLTYYIHACVDNVLLRVLCP